MKIVPWKVVMLWRGNGHDVPAVQIGDYVMQLPPVENQLELAKFIVKAANAHDEMFEALKNLIIVAQNADPEDVWREAEEAKAIIAKIEGEKIS